MTQELSLRDMCLQSDEDELKMTIDELYSYIKGQTMAANLQEIIVSSRLNKAFSTKTSYMNNCNITSTFIFKPEHTKPETKSEIEVLPFDEQEPGLC